MNEEKTITRRELELREKNMVLEISANITAVIDERFERFQNRLDASNITRRDQLLFEATGFTYENRGKSSIAIQHAYKEAVKAEDTRNKVKNAIISGSLMATIAASVAWLIQYLKGD